MKILRGSSAAHSREHGDTRLRSSAHTCLEQESNEEKTGGEEEGFQRTMRTIRHGEEGDNEEEKSVEKVDVERKEEREYHRAPAKSWQGHWGVPRP